MRKYKRQSPYFDFKNLKKNMEGMTFQEKVDHIWTYYKELFLVFFLVGVILYAVIWTLIAPKEKPLFDGVLCNVSMKQECYYYLTEQYRQNAGFEKPEDVSVTSLVFTRPLLVSEVGDSYKQSMALISMVEAKTVDYMLLDLYAMEFYISHEIYMDLRDFFTEEELEIWKDQLIYAVPDDGSSEAYPIAVNVTEMPFIKEASGEETYLAFAANTERMADCRSLWEFILAWEQKK